MKAEDLMINDWVIADGVPAQILSLGRKGATITGGFDKACHYDNMQPIPSHLKSWRRMGLDILICHLKIFMKATDYKFMVEIMQMDIVIGISSVE